MAFTTVAEFAKYLRRAAFEVGSDEEAQAQQALDAAVDTIENEAGQTLESSTDTITLDGKGGRELLVPRWPVTSVTSVTVDGIVLVFGEDEDFTWSDYGVIERHDDCWPTTRRSIGIVYTAGLATIPLDLKRIAWRLAASTWDNPGGLESEKIGDWSGKWTSGMLSGELSEADKRVISRYAVIQ